MKLNNPILATLYLEVLVPSRNTALRIAISTMYTTPKLSGSNLRLPMPIRTGWFNLCVDVHGVLSEYGLESPIPVTGALERATRVRRVTFCSSMEVTVSTATVAPKSMQKVEFIIRLFA